MRVSMMALVALLALLACSAVVVQAADSQQGEVSEYTKAMIEADHKYLNMLDSTDVSNTTYKAQAMTTAYNYATATQLFWLSATAYCTDNTNLAAWSCTSCQKFGQFKVTAVMDDTANQGFVGYFTQGLPSSPIPGSVVGANEPFVVVSFRGTVPSDLKDWIEDLSFSKQTPFNSNYPGVHVHGGFWGAYMDMKPKLMAGLNTAFSISGARALIVVGHSLGAAMAELAALDLRLNEYPSKIYASWTLGTPRPGDANFAALYSQVISASFREIHQADLVPHLPPMLLGFSHGPTEVWFNEAFSSYQVCSGSNGEDKSCSDSLALPVSIDDHTHYRGVSVGGFCTDASSVEGKAMMEFQVPQARQVDSLAQAAQDDAKHQARKKKILREF